MSSDDSQHAELHGRIREEFSRQSGAFAQSPAMQSAAALDRIAEGLALANTDRVLDVACGPGLVVERLAASAAHVTGIDLTGPMLDRARERCAGLSNVAFELGVAERLPFPDASFDATISRLAIHHFPDPGVVVDEMKRVTRPGGKIAIVDICSSDDPEEARLHNALEVLRDPSHVRMLSRGELTALLEDRDLALADRHAWTQRREFEEWVAITRSDARSLPLRVIFGTLADAGLRAGIDLQRDGSELRFDHHWQLLVSVRGS